MPKQKIKVDADGAAQRLDVFLAQTMKDGPSRSFVKKLIDANHVTVNKKPAKANYKVVEGDTIDVEIPKNFLVPDNIDAENIKLDVFYEDEYLVVINKPIGMMVHPASGNYSGTLVNALLYKYETLSDVNSDVRPGIVHRLDQDTSGLILVAKDNITHAELARQFQDREISKRYVALVGGNVEFDQGVIDAPIGRNPFHRDKKSVQYDETAKDALTYYEVLKRKNGASLIALFPQTGRTHQLRVHMAFLGHPILGDQKYGKQTKFPRLALHAQSIGFTHPKSGRYLELSSIVPKEFQKHVA